MNNPEIDRIIEIARILKKSKSILFITGAGISADSGLPTYRGVGGLYNQGQTEEGMPIEMVLAGEMLLRRPEITWKYLGQIEKNCRRAKFNRGHEVIALSEGKFERVWVLTQNIDGFHYRAGTSNIIDIHGDMHKLLCSACGWQETVDDYSRIEIPPKCPECGKPVRPDVVFFGEMLSGHKLQILTEELQRGFDIYFSIGTTSVFPYIQQPIIDASHRGRPTVEINPAKTQVSDIVDIRIAQGAAEALDEIWEAYLKLSS